MPVTYGKTGLLLPTPSADGVTQAARLSKYGEAMVVPISAGLYGIAAEGSYYKLLNQTVGTAYAGAITTAFSATAAFMTLYNTDANKSVYLDYIKLILTVVPASATSMHLAVAIDSINRYASGGTTGITPQNPNGGVANGSVVTASAGAVVAAAASAARYLVRENWRTVIPVVGDTLFLNFGAQDTMPGPPKNGTVPSAFGIPAGPVIIKPGGSVVLHMWAPANAVTGPSYEVEAGWWER